MNMPVPSLGIVYSIVLPLALAQTATASQPMALSRHLVAGEGVGHVAIGGEEGARMLGLDLDQLVDDLLHLVAGEQRAHRLAGDHRAPDQQIAERVVDHRDLALVNSGFMMSSQLSGARRHDGRIVHQRQRAPVPRHAIELAVLADRVLPVNCGISLPNCAILAGSTGSSSPPSAISGR